MKEEKNSELCLGERMALLYAPDCKPAVIIKLPGKDPLARLRKGVFGKSIIKEALTWLNLTPRLLLIFDAQAEKKQMKPNAFLIKKRNEMDRVIYGNYVICKIVEGSFDEEDRAAIRKKIERIWLYRRIKEDRDEQ